LALAVIGRKWHIATYAATLNMRAVKALGFEIPPTLLLRADEVIE
jgi:hypothetical protein